MGNLSNAYGIGFDYMITRYSTNIADALAQWNTYISTIKSMGFNTVRLLFAFPNSGSSAHTIIDSGYANFDQVLSLLFQNNLGVIFDLHNFEDMYGYFGSDAWVNSWVNLVNHLNSAFPNNTHVVAYELFNEPTDVCISSQVPTGTDRWFKAYVKCVDPIRATGDSKPIVYSSPYFLRSFNGESDRDTSIDPSLVRPNIVVTLHEWYYQDDLAGMQSSFNSKSSREQVWYDAGWDLWLGEYGESNEGLSDAQKEWARLWTVWAIEHGIGFNWYMHHGFSNYANCLAACEQAMVVAGFTGGNVTLPYHNPLTSLSNLSIINGAWSVS